MSSRWRKWFETVMRKFRTALTLPTCDWRVIFQAWILLLVVDWSLRLLPFSHIQKLTRLGTRSPRNLTDAATSGIVLGLARMVSIAAGNHLYAMRCLRQSLVLQWLLGRRGITADLRIGVRKELDGLHAHAWLEHAGQAIGKREAITSRFAPLLARETRQ